jgi:hypothetical protein
MFACAHPAIDAGIRAPLILQVVLGLDAKMIASTFLTSPEAMGKRLVRAKDKIRQAGIPFRVPEREEIPGRLDTVLDAIFAAFTEGWTEPGGTDVVRRDLTEEAMFLARLVTELLPEEPEALSLLALMLHAEARRRARRNPHGEYVPLAAQDSELWDAHMILEAEAWSGVPALWAPLDVISWKARCSRRTFIAAARITPTGQTFCGSTTRCSCSPARQWSRSIAHWRSRRCMAPAPVSTPRKRWPTMRGSPNTEVADTHLCNKP